MEVHLQGVHRHNREQDSYGEAQTTGEQVARGVDARGHRYRSDNWEGGKQ